MKKVLGVVLILFSLSIPAQARQKRALVEPPPRGLLHLLMFPAFVARKMFRQPSERQHCALPRLTAAQTFQSGGIAVRSVFGDKGRKPEWDSSPEISAVPRAWARTAVSK